MVPKTKFLKSYFQFVRAPLLYIKSCFFTLLSLCSRVSRLKIPISANNIPYKLSPFFSPCQQNNQLRHFSVRNLWQKQRKTKNHPVLPYDYLFLRLLNLQQNKNKPPMSSQSNPTSLQYHILKRFTVIKKIGSGAYGHVWKIEQKNTKKIFALKKIFDAFQHATDAQRTYRQIEVLRQLDHPNIIKLHETIPAENNKDVYLIFEYMEADLHNVISQSILQDIHMKFIIYQLAKALKYLHSGKVIHRDLKPSNVLVNSNCSIKLCDFGLVRCLKTEKSLGVMTQGVATRWYRSPEILFGSRKYSAPADIWSFGCIVYEILTEKVLFSGNSTLDQIQKICAFTGYPSEEDIQSLQSQISRSLIKEMKAIPMNSSRILKEINKDYADLLEKILIFNPKKRMNIQEILNHQSLKQFHKPEQQISNSKEITLLIDDSKKISVDQYRNLIYGVSPTQSKTKVLAYSLSAGSVSPKYQPIPAKSPQPISTEQHVAPEMTSSKKSLFNKPKQISGIAINNSQDPKNQEKVQLGARFARSTKDTGSGNNSIHSFHHKKFLQQPLQKEETQNQQDIDTAKTRHPVEVKPKTTTQKTEPNLSPKTNNPFPFSFKYSPNHLHPPNAYQSGSKSPQYNPVAPSFFSVTDLKEKMEVFKPFKSGSQIPRTPESAHKFINSTSPKNT